MVEGDGYKVSCFPQRTSKTGYYCAFRPDAGMMPMLFYFNPLRIFILPELLHNFFVRNENGRRRGAFNQK